MACAGHVHTRNDRNRTNGIPDEHMDVTKQRMSTEREQLRVLVEECPQSSHPPPCELQAKVEKLSKNNPILQY